METETRNRAVTSWEKSDRSLENYKRYITRKPDRFHLTLIDLLYVSNFKGGNATITEDEHVIETKLKSYSKCFIEISNDFEGLSLCDVPKVELEELIKKVNAVLKLSEGEETKIDGFKSSFLSALLHSYFPKLLPIIDRRVLINLGLVQEEHLMKPSKQVKDIGSFYKHLLRIVYAECKLSKKSVREIDKMYFTPNLPDWAR